jgi:hypothetical protein
MILTPVITGAKFTAVTATSAVFSAAMVAGQFWQFTSSTNCWIKQGATPTAVVGTVANLFVPANVVVTLSGSNGADLAVIRDSADGKASLVGCATF